METRVEKVLAVGGLRGTGKTTGILQAAEDMDTAYILAQKTDNRTGEDYIRAIKEMPQKNIIIDEYSWINDRKPLDYYLLTAVQDGKRIVITGTESITLDYLNYGALNHRVGTLHTTMFTYDEYRKIHGLQHSQEVCDKYLKEGGVFEKYAIKNFDSMKEYVENAIVDNLSGYLKKEMDEEKARALTYAVLYKAICPSNLSRIPVFRDHNENVGNFLGKMGINTEINFTEWDLNRVADLFDHAGIIVRIPNYDKQSPIKEQFYITNPSLSCQMIRAAYDQPDLNKDVLGHVFESSVMVQLASNKLSEHKIFFLNSSGQSNGASKELNAIITDREEEYVYFFECKHMKSSQIKADATLLSGYVEEHYFPYSEIDGRYVIYNGEPCVKEYPVGEVLFTPPVSNVLDNYFVFRKNIESVQPHTDISEYKKEEKSDVLDMAKEKRNADTLSRQIEELKESISSLTDQQKEKIESSFSHKHFVSNSFDIGR